MLQDELTKLTLTELEKKDERQDAERVCPVPFLSFNFFLIFPLVKRMFYFFSASTAWLFFHFFFFLSLSFLYFFQILSLSSSV